MPEINEIVKYEFNDFQKSKADGFIVTEIKITRSDLGFPIMKVKSVEDN